LYPWIGRATTRAIGIKEDIKEEFTLLIGGTEFLVSFTHLGEKEEKESFTEGDIISICGL